jgi:hypothetical protein
MSAGKITIATGRPSQIPWEDVFRKLLIPEYELINILEEFNVRPIKLRAEIYKRGFTKLHQQHIPQLNQIIRSNSKASQRTK